MHFRKPAAKRRLSLGLLIFSLILGGTGAFSSASAGIAMAKSGHHTQARCARLKHRRAHMSRRARRAALRRCRRRRAIDIASTQDKALKSGHQRPVKEESTSTSSSSETSSSTSTTTETSTSETPTTTSTSSTHFRFFSPSSFWNTQPPSNAPLDPVSAEIISALNTEVAAEEQAEKGPYIATSRWSVPVYTVPASQPTIRVSTSNPEALALQAAWNSVPLPENAQAAAGTDKHLAVWQPSTNRLWEFWRLENDTSGWHAAWGGAMENVSSNPGVYGPEAWPGATLNWGATATSFSDVGGLITLEDLERGEINHALALGIPNVRAGLYSSPAHRDDGTSTSLSSLPEGAHLRLEPSLNIASLSLPPITRMIAEAAQKYGIFVRSKAGNVDFYAQDPTPTGANPYTGPTGYFEGKLPYQLLASFPWSSLQLLQMELHPDH